LQGESDISCFKKRKIVLVLGNEGKGISKNLLEEACSIFHIRHNKKAVESLNVASAGAICMHIVNNIHQGTR
jgi:tRNA G18 (ribose-2'-O)-methylase SpoU